MSEIIPAILAKSTAELELKLAEIPEEIKFVHIDVLDPPSGLGRAGENIWTSQEIKKDFEVHLMVREPEEIVERWIERGAKRIMAHKFIGVEGAEMGLAVELHVPLEDIYPVIPQLDFLNLMSIAEIGAQGHPFNERIFDRIREVKERFPEVVLSIDGGINVTNYKKLEDLGVDRLVVGSGFKDLWQLLTKE